MYCFESSSASFLFQRSIFHKILLSSPLYFWQNKTLIYFILVTDGQHRLHLDIYQTNTCLYFYSQAADNSSIHQAMTYIASVINYVIDPLRGGTLSKAARHLWLYHRVCHLRHINTFLWMRFLSFLPFTVSCLSVPYLNGNIHFGG